MWFLVALDRAPLGYAVNNVVVALIRPAEATHVAALDRGDGLRDRGDVPLHVGDRRACTLFEGATGGGGSAGTVWAGVTDIVILLGAVQR